MKRHNTVKDSEKVKLEKLFGLNRKSYPPWVLGDDCIPLCLFFVITLPLY